MKKRYEITEEEFEVIKKAIEDVLQFWHYNFINVSNENGASMQMNKETFFRSLRDEFIS